MKNFVNAELLKAEDEQKYKHFAEKGMDLFYPAKVQGQEKRADIGIPYHASIKLFQPGVDRPEDIHQIASKLDMTPPNPKEVRIKPSIFTSQRGGYKMHVLEFEGPHADRLAGHNDKFSHMGYEQNYKFKPHITVDKPTFDKIVQSGAKTAHEAGIEFGHAELRHGPKVLYTYKPAEAPKEQPVEPDKAKLAASEGLEKGTLKNVATALGVAGAMAAGTANAPAPSFPEYSSQKMLHSIAQVESSKGQDTDHKPVGGIHENESAYGRWGLMPNTIRETIQMNRGLRSKHGKAVSLRGQDLHNYMQDNPGLEEQIAKQHLARLEHHFGQDHEKIGFSWNQGITGTNKAVNQKRDIAGHPYVQKIKRAYVRGK